MTDLVDLLHGQEEVRFCSALAILLQYDDGDRPLLRGLLKLIEQRWTREPNGSAFSHVQDEGMEIVDVDISVEEPVEGADADGRYDLVVRFGLQRKGADSPTLFTVIVEAKVAAIGAHGQQFSTYREGLALLRKRTERVGEVLFGLLTVDPRRALANFSKQDEEIVQFHLGWADIQAIIDEMARKNTSIDGMRGSFCDSLRRWTVKLEDYRAILKSDALLFPVLLDALDSICTRLSARCGANKKFTDPRGAQGPVWIEKSENGADEKHDGCYRYGHWWRVGSQGWASLSVAWHFFKRGAEKQDAHLAPGGEGYVPYLELWTSQEGKEKPAALLAQSAIFALLSEEAIESAGDWLLNGAEGKPPFGV